MQLPAPSSYPQVKVATNVDRVSRNIELSVYASLIGIACFVAFVYALIMLPFASLRHHRNPVRTRLTNKLLTHIRDRRQRNNAAVLVAIGVLLSCGFVLALLLTTKKWHTAESDDDGDIQREFFRLSPQVGCNGRADLCDRKVTEIAWLTTHNSMATADDHFFAPNHYYSFREQLQAGVRSFMIDIHPGPPLNGSLSQLRLCHGSCDLGAYPLERDLIYLKDFLGSNRSNVVMLLVESYVSTSQVVAALRSAGMEDLLWSVPSADPATRNTPHGNQTFEWPTLQKLIDGGHQVLLFVDTPVDPSPVHPDWIHFLWYFFFENNFDTKEVYQLDCGYNRGWNGSNLPAMRRKGTILNHFLTNPVGAPFLSAAANRPSALKKHYERCQKEWGVSALNAVAVDFWTMHSPLRTVNNFNNKK